ncbi:MAG TPA: hypothetical protein VGH99_22600 [Pseudonocardia sp.]|jgi:hypothetical protein
MIEARYPIEREMAGAADAGRPSSADVSERMFLEFRDSYDLHEISDVVQECRAALKHAPAHSYPALLEALVRERLSALAVAATPVSVL